MLNLCMNNWIYRLWSFVVKEQYFQKAGKYWGLHKSKIPYKHSRMSHKIPCQVSLLHVLEMKTGAVLSAEPLVQWEAILALWWGLRCVLSHILYVMAFKVGWTESAVMVIAKPRIWMQTISLSLLVPSLPSHINQTSLTWICPVHLNQFQISHKEIQLNHTRLH